MEAKQQGTTVKLHLNERGQEYASRWRIEGIVRKYSNHIPFPIHLHYTEDKKDKKEKVEQINSASALWRRPKAEIKDEEYNEFYKTLSHDQEDPLAFMHTRAEGALEYTTLFFIPRQAPPDLFWVNYRPGVKLYVKRVFITDDEKELLPTYLRFVHGVIDSEDLPLNVSREMLQENQVLRSIRTAAVKKILGELEKMAQNTPEKYKDFYKEFGICIKEGLYQDPANRESLLALVRYKSSSQEGLDLAGRLQGNAWAPSRRRSTTWPGTGRRSCAPPRCWRPIGRRAWRCCSWTTASTSWWPRPWAATRTSS